MVDLSIGKHVSFNRGGSVPSMYGINLNFGGIQSPRRVSSSLTQQVLIKYSLRQTATQGVRDG
jgi:hypothetical protein